MVDNLISVIFYKVRVRLNIMFLFVFYVEVLCVF